MAKMNLRQIQLIREMERKRNEPEMRYMPHYAEPEMRRVRYPHIGYKDDMPMDRRMGFGERDGYDHEMRRRRSDGTWMHHGYSDEDAEPIKFGGMVSMSGGKGSMKMTREMAEEWVDSMEGDDPAKPSGGKWTPEQIKPVAQKYGVPTEGDRFWTFYAVMNAMYSDYYSVAKKHNALNQDFFADMAMAFINDKDAVRNKAAVYYECIAKG